MNALLNQKNRAPLAFAVMALLLLGVGMGQSWPFALAILNLCLISAITVSYTHLTLPTNREV